MSFGKNKSSNTQSSVSSSDLDPQIKGLLLQNVAQAGTVANRPYQAYTGERVAGFNDIQQSAQQRSLDFARQGVGRGLLSEAAGLARTAAAYQPQQVSGQGYSAITARPVASVAYQPATTTNVTTASAGDAREATAAQVNRSDIRDVSAGLLDRAAIDAYLNPHTDEVVNTTLADLERQRAIQESLNNAAARKAGAFGGTGAAVAASLTNEDFTRRMASTAADLRSQGFNTALTAAQQDAARALEAQRSNQSADLGVATTNAGLLNSVSLENARAANQRGEFNANLEQQGLLANADAANRASLANAQGLLTAAQANQETERALSLADAAAGNRASEFSAGQDFEAQRANQQAGLAAANLSNESARLLSSFSDQERDQLLQDIQVEGSVGDAAQALKQRLLDIGYEDWEAEQQFPILMQEIRNNAIGLVGNPILSTSKSTGSSKSSGFNVGLPLPA